MKQIATRLPQLVAVLACIAAVALVNGQTATCVNDYLQRDDHDPARHGPREWRPLGNWLADTIRLLRVQQLVRRVRGNAFERDLQRDGALQRHGRDIYCTGTGQHFFCLTGDPTSSVNLTRNCAGGPCAVPGGTNDTRHGNPGADETFLDETNPHPPLPAPNPILH